MKKRVTGGRIRRYSKRLLSKILDQSEVRNFWSKRIRKEVSGLIHAVFSPNKNKTKNKKQKWKPNPAIRNLRRFGRV